jgi:UDP-N-acetylmuramoyl-tripeptide--D-alanyl-D-alanine ligase
LDQEGCGHFSLQGRFFHLVVPGRHQVYNALAAAAVGAALDVPVEQAAKALGAFRPSKLRGQVVEQNGIRLLNDSYNANPASMRAALETLAQMSITEGARRVAILGDMLEMGTSAIQSHRRLGMLAARLGMDAIFALGYLSEHVSEGGVSGGLSPKRSRAFKDRATLVTKLKAFLKPGDLVLMKGSRGLAMETTAEALGFEIKP